ncbi:ABC transporter permease [Ancylobacter dichloromethanicus]|uniref:Spermidine/putrescine ABC transporter permease n=1 Tax=Ancylobacter dichloromethanicus TaxID=518825 RepID=A0A9W6MYU0_9HYPH|nr:ABC transporter permease [Ancylobacter dichloromethanicus]MBS7552661.1 ABC transporter permease [Ancylobacter dichloromethanicus]GLK72024.1 spermidine/putrescine ABC transporter permease [Ancylobacter dichloromethanicus]
MADLAIAHPERQAAAESPAQLRQDRLLSVGARCALPVALLLGIGFLAPLVAILGYAFATPRSFDVFSSFTLANFATLFDPANTVWLSFFWSCGLALFTVAILAVVAYPIAYGLNMVFGRWSALISVLFVFPLFVSENVRLYGWVLFYIRNGVLDGSLKWLGLPGGPEVLYTPGITLFGMVYTYLPFMLFPMTLGLALVPRDLVDAARDLGAGRLFIWREIELPLAMPGILIGMLLTFVLAIGATAEAKILGGQSIIVISHDIEIAFTYSQNWPLGSALAVVVTFFIGALTLFALSKLDLDRMLGKR